MAWGKIRPPGASAANRVWGSPGVYDQPPAGFYDPSLDAQQRAAGRGLQDLTSDTAQQQSRLDSDYQLGQNQLRTTSGRTLADLLSEHNRFGEDTQTKLSDIARGFQRLGQSQAQMASARGLSSGALRKAMTARQGNEQLQRAPVLTAQTREGQDYGTNVTRTNEDLSTGLAEMGRQYGYQSTDLSTALGRGQRENLFYGQDIGAQKIFQAGQMGWTIPRRR
jgi:hypothetical protein